MALSTVIAMRMLVWQPKSDMRIVVDDCVSALSVANVPVSSGVSCALCGLSVASFLIACGVRDVWVALGMPSVPVVSGVLVMRCVFRAFGVSSVSLACWLSHVRRRVPFGVTFVQC